MDKPININNLTISAPRAQKSKRYVPNLAQHSELYQNLHKKADPSNAENPPPFLTDSQLAENWRKSGGKVAEKWRKSGGKVAEKWRKTGGKVADELAEKWRKTGGKVAENWRKTGGKVADELTEIPCFASLSGHQRNITLLIFNHLKYLQQDYTEPLSLKMIAEAATLSIKSIKDTLYELAKKKVLVRYNFKNGRGGWTQYKLVKPIFDELRDLDRIGKLAENWRKSGGKLADLRPSSSSSINIINNNTTTTTAGEELDPWANLQIPQILKDHRFTPHVVTQVKNRGLLSPEELQKAFDAFAFDIQENKILEKKKINSAISWFMGSINRSNTYVAPVNFKSDQEKAQEEMIRREEERAREIEKNEERLMHAKFVLWKAELSQKEIKEISPVWEEEEYVNRILKDHYREKVWPKVHLCE